VPNLVQIAHAGVERLAERLLGISLRRGAASRLPAHLAVGIAGEQAACFYLLKNGFQVVARRWSAANLEGDLDLVAWQGDLLCFVEVKSRTAHDLNPAEIAVDQHKRRLLRRLARAYLRLSGLPAQTQTRFDILAVYLLANQKQEFQHFTAAFGWSEDGQRDSWN
jgi:putative endonuclease